MLHRAPIAALLCGLLIAPSQAQDAPDRTGSAAALQPFVDSHSLAGAVALVADKDKVLDVEAVGYSDVSAKDPHEARRACSGSPRNRSRSRPPP